MRSPKRIIKILIATGLLLLVGIIFYKLASNELVHCYLVRWSRLDQLAPNLYVDPDMPDFQRQTMLSSVDFAKEQIAALYGDTIAEPVIIAGHTMEVMKFYGGNAYNRAGRTYITPIAAFIVLGPDGVGSRDILSHEFAHAVFAEKVGYWNRKKVPNWFDEGLAMQFDGRYTELEWQNRTDHGRLAPDLDQIGTIKHDDWMGYATAKHEVKRWLDIVGQEGFLNLLQSIQNGDDFQGTYRFIEEDHSTP